MATDSASPTLSHRPEMTPEESALVDRIAVFVTMRWLAIAGVIVAVLLATQVFHIGLSLTPILLIVAFMALYNFVLFLQARDFRAEAAGTVPRSTSVPLGRLFEFLKPIVPKPRAASPLIEKARAIGNIHIALDLIALTALLHYTGGIENPFIFYFVFHAIIAGILLHYRIAYLVASAAIYLVLLLVGLEYYELIPHVHIEGFLPPDLYKDGPYIISILVALATCLFGSVFMVNHISGELRKRQRELVALKDQGLLAKTQELEQASKELVKLEEGRKHLLRFLAIASHDLKAPLAAVQSYLQLMLGGFVGEISEKQRHMLDRSSKRIAELLTLISDLLDISRIEGGQIVKEMEETSLPQVIAKAIEDVSAAARAKQLKLETGMPEALPPLRASAVRLQQVLTNLLSNAVRFTPEQGVIKVNVTMNCSSIQVAVADTGCGIAAEELPRLFTDFYRGPDREKSGTGLGLSIVKRVVEAHGGRVWVESPNPEDELKRGARFTFVLPGSLILPPKAGG